MAVWNLHGDGRRVADGVAVQPDERLSWPLTIGFGVQHVLVMFSATVVVPLLTHFPVTTTLLFSGLGTLLFVAVTRHRVPSYLGSSFAFIAPLTAAANAGLPAQLGAVVMVGLVLTAIGVAVKALGVRLLESVLPPVVTGAVIMMIGLSLAGTAAKDFELQPLLGVVTLVAVLGCAVAATGLVSRASVLLAVLVGWVLAALFGDLDPATLDALRAAPWIGLPTLTMPQLQPSTVVLVLPVVIVVLAENVGHVKAVGTITGRNLDGNTGDVLIGNGLATTLAGLGGGSGTTTYAENIAVMAASRMYSTAAYVVAGLFAVGLSFSPKLNALITTVPPGVVGGVTVVMYGLLALLGARVWITARVDFADPVNLLVAAAALIIGVGNVSVSIGGVTFGGLACGTCGIVLCYPVLRALHDRRHAVHR